MITNAPSGSHLFFATLAGPRERATEGPRDEAVSSVVAYRFVDALGSAAGRLAARGKQRAARR